jgi:hypothetical protein
MGKFAGSTMVVAYGFSLAYIGYHFAERESWHRMIVRPVCISIAICAAFAAIEMLASGGGTPAVIYQALLRVVHTSFQYPDNLPENISDWSTVGRVRSLCFEPPALAAFAGLAWPWAYVGAATATRRTMPLYGMVLVLCTGLILVAMSRTSAVLLVGNIVVYGLLRLVYLSPRPRSTRTLQIASVSLLTLGIALLAESVLRLDAFTAAILRDSQYVSNISRYSLITSGFAMFFARPLGGFGFGQFGFHFVEFLPRWGYESWEIRNWVAGVNGSWPSVFSIYARLAGETGIVGVTIWIGVWLALVRSVWRATVAYQHATGKLLMLSYPLIMSCFCALFTGIAVDSVRMPMMWLSMGIACCYVQDVQRRLGMVRSMIPMPAAPVFPRTFALSSVSGAARRRPGR